MKTAYAEIFGVLLTITVPLAAYATGLRAPKEGVLWLWKQPGLLLRSLLSILILVPLGTVLLLLAVGVPPPARGGILIAVLAVGIGPISAYKRGPASHYETGLVLTLLLVSIGFLPAAVALINSVFGLSVPLRPGPVAQVVLTKALAPLLLGMITTRLLPWFAERAGRWAGWFVNLATLALVILAIPIIGRPALALGGTAWLMCALVAAGAIVVGHLLGGPDRSDRAVLASFSAMRFPALGLLLASVVPNGRTMVPVVLAYVVVSGVLVAAYRILAARRQRKRPAPQDTSVRAPLPAE